MKFRLSKCAILLFITFSTLSLWTGDAIPQIAWQRGIGEPLPNPGTRELALNDLIDDGYWQGAPVGGFGSGTFSRTYRGDFSRWHLKAGIHKYETVYSNQLAIYEKSEGASESIAQVLLADHPKNQDLPSWKWGYWFRSPEALRDRRQFPRLDVYAPSRDLGDGDDRTPIRRLASGSICVQIVHAS